MWEGHDAVFQNGFSTAVAFLEETGGGDDRGLDLAVAESFAFVDRYFSTAGSLEAAELVVFLWIFKLGNHYFDGEGLNQQNLPLTRWISDGKVSQFSSPRFVCPRTSLLKNTTNISKLITWKFISIFLEETFHLENSFIKKKSLENFDENFIPDFPDCCLFELQKSNSRICGICLGYLYSFPILGKLWKCLVIDYKSPTDNACWTLSWH